MWVCEAPSCGAAFVDEPSLERHHRTGLHHADPYCYPCDQHFRSINSLYSHLENSPKHTGEAKDTAKCEHCENHFLVEFTLSKHQDQCESNWYNCQVENCTFVGKSDNVDLHIARVHDGAKLKNRAVGNRKAKKIAHDNVNNLSLGAVELPEKTTPIEARHARDRLVPDVAPAPVEKQRPHEAQHQQQDEFSPQDPQVLVHVEEARFQSQGQQAVIHSPRATKPQANFAKILDADHEAVVTLTASELPTQHTAKNTPRPVSFGIHSYDGTVTASIDVDSKRDPEETVTQLLSSIDKLSTKQIEILKQEILTRTAGGELKQELVKASKPSSKPETLEPMPAPPQDLNRSVGYKLSEFHKKIQNASYTTKKGASHGAAPARLAKSDEREQTDLSRLQAHLQAGQASVAHSTQGQSSFAQPSQQIKRENVDDDLARKIASLSQTVQAEHVQAVMDNTPMSNDWFTPQSDSSAGDGEQKASQVPDVPRQPTPLQREQKYNRLDVIVCPQCPVKVEFNTAGLFSEHYIQKHSFGKDDLPLCRGCNRTFKSQKSLKYHLQDCVLGKEAHLLIEEEDKPKFPSIEFGSAYVLDLRHIQKEARENRVRYEKAERERAEKEKLERERYERERLERERLEKEKRDNILRNGNRTSKNASDNNYGRLTPPDNLSPSPYNVLTRENVNRANDAQPADTSEKSGWSRPSSVAETVSTVKVDRDVETSSAEFTPSAKEIEKIENSRLGAQKTIEKYGHKFLTGDRRPEGALSFARIQEMVMASVRINPEAAKAAGLDGYARPIKRNQPEGPAKVETLEDSQWASNSRNANRARASQNRNSEHHFNVQSRVQHPQPATLFGRELVDNKPSTPNHGNFTDDNKRHGGNRRHGRR